MAEGKANVLYVDDEPNNLVAFTASFRKYYNIFTATSAREGLDLLHRNKVEVVITDQRMPSMTGIQFLETIIPEFPETVRMLLTGFSDIEAVINAINTGRVFRYIQKPWDRNELKLSIDQAIKMHRLESNNRELVNSLHDEVAVKERILGIFQSYVPQSIVQEVLSAENEDSIVHLAETRIVSILFSDIRDFTKLADRCKPDVVVKFLNDYFSLMSECVEKHQGSVNKFMGDGLLAIFGAPISYIDNASNSVRCALEMLELIKDFSASCEKEIDFKVNIGIGVNTGEVIAGMIGSIKHVEYTVIGDTVNVASRIENLTKTLPNTVLISDSTYKDVVDDFEIEKMGLETLRGKGKEMEIYKVLRSKSKY